MQDSPQVSIIIPTLLAGDDLRECIKSIADDQSAPDHEVLVVFNAPKPSDIDLQSLHPNCRAIQAPTNIGFAAACNLGAREAISPTLAFLNDDMTIQTGWLAALIAVMESSECDAVGGRILASDGKKYDFDGSSINLLGWGFQTGRGENVTDDEFSSIGKIPFACGGNFAINADVFEKSGGFDGDFFAFYEDVDLGWRLRLMGHEIAYARDAATLHKGGSTGSLLAPPLKWFLQERNSLQTIIKNYSQEILDRILPVAFALVSVRAQILSGMEFSDIATDRTWREWITAGEKPAEGESPGMWKGLVDSVKESLKSGMKSARKANLPDGWLPVESRGAAGLFALEWILNNWDRLWEKRGKVQGMRVKGDSEILPMFDDPLRPVLGHPREVAAMKPLEGILREILSA
jgi:GT2 family glycosyltransferase